MIQRRGNLEGILWAMGSTLCFVGVTVIVRHLGSSMDPMQAAFIRYFFGLLLLFPVLMRMDWGAVSFPGLRLHAVRGIVHAAGVALWFYAMTRIPIAEVTALGFTAPIFTTIGAALFLGETLRIRRVTAVIIGFLGTLVILRPGLAVIDIGAVAQLTAAPLFACSMLIAKKMTDRESPINVVAFMGIFVTLALLPGAVMVWRTPTLLELFWLLVTAVVATVGHYCVTRAYSMAEISVTQPVSFTQLVWASLAGYYLFAEVPDLWTWIGGGIIVASASYIAHREARGNRAEA